MVTVSGAGLGCSDESDGGGGAIPPDLAPTCEDVGGSAEVAMPTLRMTLPGSWDENWLASPGIFDLDGDGSPEIVAARHSVLYVHAANGELLWLAPWGQEGTTEEAHGSARSYCSPVVGDLDGDGLGEIVGVSGDQVFIYDHSGHLLRSHAFGNGELRSLAAADLEPDGVHEILVVQTGSGPVTQILDWNGGVRPGWPQIEDDSSSCSDCIDYGGYNQNIGVGDLDGDGALEVVATYDGPYFGVFHGDGQPLPIDDSFAGNYFASVPMFHDLALAQQGWGEDGNDRDELTDSPPVVADMDGDGDAEIVLVGDREVAGELVIRGNSFWVLNADMTRPEGWEVPKTTGEPLYTGYESNLAQVPPVPAVADFHPSPGLEIVAPSYDGHMYAFAADGTELWRFRFDEPGDPFVGASGPLVVDLTGDGAAEVIFASYSLAEGVSQLFILSSAGAVRQALPIDGRGTMAPPSIADLDGDGQLELVVSLKDALGGGLGGVQVWELPGSSSNCLLWPTGRGDYLRRGYVP